VAIYSVDTLDKGIAHVPSETGGGGGGVGI
jgi:hypothetical protein